MHILWGWRIMVSGFPQAQMPQNLCDDLIILDEQNYFHRSWTVKTHQGVYVIHQLKPLSSMMSPHRPARMIRLRSSFFGARNPLSVQLLRRDKFPDRCRSFDLKALDRLSDWNLPLKKSSRGQIRRRTRICLKSRPQSKKSYKNTVVK